MSWVKKLFSKCLPCFRPRRAATTTAFDRRFRFPTSGDTEYAEYYRPDGFHPVLLGDVFNSRYRVVLKLGFGCFSTVWLSVDDQ